jgi:hypothetical protein
VTDFAGLDRLAQALETDREFDLGIALRQLMALEVFAAS